MAVALRSSTHLGYGSHTNPSLTVPSGVQSGDVVIACVLIFSASTPTAPSITGFTAWPGTTGGQLTQAVNFGGVTNATETLYAFYKVAGGSEGSTYSATQAANSSDYWVAAYTGVDNTSPVGSFTGTAAPSSGAQNVSTAGSVTPTVNGSQIVIVSGDNGDTTNNLSLTGYTNEIASPVVLGILDTTQATAAATGSQTFTNNTSSFDSGPAWTTGVLVLNAVASSGSSVSGGIGSNYPGQMYPAGVQAAAATIWQGTASLSSTFSSTEAGTVLANGAASFSSTFSATESGKTLANGSASLASTFGATVTGASFPGATVNWSANAIATLTGNVVDSVSSTQTANAVAVLTGNVVYSGKPNAESANALATLTGNVLSTSSSTQSANAIAVLTGNLLSVGVPNAQFATAGATLTGNGIFARGATFSANALASLSATAVFSGAATQNATANAVAVGNAVWNQPTSFTAATVATVNGGLVDVSGANFSASTALVSTSAVLRNSSETMSATGGLSFTSKVLYNGVAVFSSTSSLAGTGVLINGGTGSYNSTGSLTASAVNIANASSSQSSTTTLTTAGAALRGTTQSFVATGELDVTGQLQGVVSAIFESDSDGTVQGSVLYQGKSTQTANAIATLTGNQIATGVANPQYATAGATLTGNGVFARSATMSANAIAVLTPNAVWSGKFTGSASSTMSVSTSGTQVGQASFSATAGANASAMKIAVGGVSMTSTFGATLAGKKLANGVAGFSSNTGAISAGTVLAAATITFTAQAELDIYIGQPQPGEAVFESSAVLNAIGKTISGVWPPVVQPVSDIFGQIITRRDVEMAVVAFLQKWVPTYIAQLESQAGLIARTLPLPPDQSLSYRGGLDFNSWEQSWAPVYIVNAEPMNAPVRQNAEGSYLQLFNVEVAVNFVATNQIRDLGGGLPEDNAREYADMLSMAACAAILQNGMIGLWPNGLPVSTDTSLQRYPTTFHPYPTDRRVARSVFAVDVLVDHVVQEAGGPSEPYEDPYQDAPDYPLVYSIHVDLTTEPV